MGRELQGEPRMYRCQTNFLVASRALRDCWTRAGKLLSGSCHISDLIAGVGEWVRAGCFREARTRHDSAVSLVYPKVLSEACIHCLGSLFFPDLVWFSLLTTELTLKAWSPH